MKPIRIAAPAINISAMASLSILAFQKDVVSSRTTGTSALTC